MLSVCISKRMQIQPESRGILDIVESCLVQHFECRKLICHVGLNVTIYLEGHAGMAASNWLTNMVENNPYPTISIFLAP